MLFQSCFSLKQSCFRAVQAVFLIQRCSALVKIRHILVWNSKNTLINTTFALFSVHFLLKTLYFSLFTILQGTCDQEAWGRGGYVNSNFRPKFRRNDFFRSWYTPKEHVFRDPNTFSNLHEAFSSVCHFVLIQRWTALIQRKPALNSSETALISAGFLNPFWNSADQRWNFWNLWNSAVQRWFALGLQPGISCQCRKYFKIMTSHRAIHSSMASIVCNESNCVIKLKSIKYHNSLRNIPLFMLIPLLAIASTKGTGFYGAPARC